MLDTDRSALLDASEQNADGHMRTHFSVPDMHCGSCMAKIENGISSLDGVSTVRANLSRRRVTVTWDKNQMKADLGQAMTRLGFDTILVRPSSDSGNARQENKLLPALSLSGCVAGNVMMMSVAVWAGADNEVRQVLHVISGVLAFISLAVAGPIFFKPAFFALIRGRSNMDVPISIGLILTFFVSVAQTLQHAQHAYFDAVTGLLFFLLVGRFLEQSVRNKIGSAVNDMRHLVGSHYQAISESGKTVSVPIEDITSGTQLSMNPGERVPVDGIVRAGCSEIDVSIISGESQPDIVRTGQAITSGTLILSSPITVEATSDRSTSLLANITSLVEETETNRTPHRQMTDRVASLYTPMVHLAALSTFLGWQYHSGDTYQSVLIAVSVLIITCPCALALAAPLVQVVAGRRLLQSGVLMKNGAALERLSSVNHVIFDKTGTLTRGLPLLANKDLIGENDLAIAAGLARNSHHPYAQAIRQAARPLTDTVGHDWEIEEMAGAGIEARDHDDVFRLGRIDWALNASQSSSPRNSAKETKPWTVLGQNGRIRAEFVFQDALRHDAKRVVANLLATGTQITVLSGDDPVAVSNIARNLGIEDHYGGLTPNEKLITMKAFSNLGQQTLMVGDGVNDAPALLAASVSMTPSSAADIGRNHADFVLLGPGLSGVTATISIARRANTLIRQNLTFSVLYNFVAVPAAIAGFVTPLVAAFAMSASSLIVALNALRLHSTKRAEIIPTKRRLETNRAPA